MTTNQRPQRRQTKTEAVCARLTEMAHRLGPNAKLPTVIEMRDSLGVSLRTLNNALGELERRNVIYRLRAVGVFVSPELRRHIALVCGPTFFQLATPSPFWQLLVDDVRARAEMRGETLSFHFTRPADAAEPLHDGLMAEIRAGLVHGVLGVGLTQAAARRIVDHGVPLVSFAGAYFPQGWTVSMDGRDIIRPGVDILVERGCRRIGLWSGMPAGGKPERDIECLAERLAAHGLSVAPSLVQVEPSNPRESGVEEGYRIARRVLTGPAESRPDGVVMSADMITVGALAAFRQLGVQPGRDIAIATHANRGSPALLGYEDELLLIEHDPAEVVRAMLDMLDTLLAGREPAEHLVLVRPRVRQREEPTPTTLP